MLFYMLAKTISEKRREITTLAQAWLPHRELNHDKDATRGRFTVVIGYQRVNDPSAGSPTETLLRLLHPLSNLIYRTFRCEKQELFFAAVRTIHKITQSVGATGGVYKGQGRNQRELMTHAY